MYALNKTWYLPRYLIRELKHVQKRGMSIICPGHSYHEALDIMNFKELAIHHDEICRSVYFIYSKIPHGLKL